MTEPCHFEIRGVTLVAADEDGSLTLERVANELAFDVYGLHDTPFQPGDIVIDIGAHAGLVSMYLAKRWPFLQIHAFEPHPLNHRNCDENLRRNGVSNVRLYAQAVNGDGSPVTLRWVGTNTGGASAAFDFPGSSVAPPASATTLDRILDDVLAPGQRCRLLKIDCEGLEYDILESATQLSRVDFLAAEFHAASVESDRPARLEEYCARFFTAGRMHVKVCVKED